MTNWTPPGLHLRPLREVRTGSALSIMLNAEETWPQEILTEPYVRLETATTPLWLVTDPYLVRSLLTHPGVTRSPLQNRFASHGTGRKSIISTSGAQNHGLRQALAPLFTGKAVAGYFPFIQKTIHQALSGAFEAGENNETIDITRSCVRATFGVIWQSAFGAKGTETPPDIVWDMADRLNEAGQSGTLSQTAHTIRDVWSRTKDMLPDHPLVEGMPFTREPPAGLDLSEEEIANNAQFFITAGHESTSLTITWLFYLLAHYPEEQDAIVAEIGAATGGGAFTFAALKKLHRLDRALNEAMRLYTSAIILSRQAAEDIQTDGLDLKQGSQIAICLYGTHRHRKYWDNPDDFRPDRFGTEAPKRFEAFMPFSVGPHTCLGGHLVWLEAMLTLSEILLKYRISAAQEVRPLARYTLRPDREVLIKLTRR